MTDREYLYISTIAQCGSITKAAEKLFIAQPSLTQSLQRIESRYGTSFFRRGKSSLHLTEAGQRYLEAGEKIQKLYEEMVYQISSVSDVEQGQMNLGFTTFQGRMLLPEVLLRYRERFPRMTVNLFETSTGQLEQLVSEGRLDVALIHTPFHDLQFNQIPLYKEPFCLAISPLDQGYETARECLDSFGQVTPELMNALRFVLPSTNYRIRQVAERVCATAGIVPKISYCTTNFLTSLSLVEKGLGATFVPLSYAKFYAPESSMLYIPFPPVWNATWELMAVYGEKRELPKAVLELIRIIQEYIDSNPEVYV